MNTGLALIAIGVSVGFYFTLRELERIRNAISNLHSTLHEVREEIKKGKSSMP